MLVPPGWTKDQVLYTYERAAAAIREVPWDSLPDNGELLRQAWQQLLDEAGVGSENNAN